jgi:hypothetical protein
MLVDDGPKFRDASSFKIFRKSSNGEKMSLRENAVFDLVL